MNKQPIKAVIFDKDGTLNDTEVLYHRAWTMVAESYGISNEDIKKDLMVCTGRPEYDIKKYWEGKYTVPFASFIEQRNQYFDRIIDEIGCPNHKGTFEILEYLKKNGYKIALATSTNYDDAMKHIDMSGIAKYFDAVVTGDMVKRGKPSPDIFLYAAEKIGVAPNMCVGVEDSPNGINAICAAGMRAVMVPDLIQPDEQIKGKLWALCETLTDLIPLLEAERSDIDEGIN